MQAKAFFMHLIEKVIKTEEEKEKAGT